MKKHICSLETCIQDKEGIQKSGATCDIASHYILRYYLGYPMFCSDRSLLHGLYISLFSYIVITWDIYVSV